MKAATAHCVIGLLWLAVVWPGPGGAQCYLTPVDDLAPPNLECRFAAADVDLDGDIDFVEFGGTWPACWRRSGTDTTEWTRELVDLVPPPSRCPTAGALGDLDADGILDLVVSTDRETLFFYAGVSADSALRWKRTSFGLEDIRLTSGSLRPHIVDLDADGDLDIAFVERNGHLGCLRRGGLLSRPSWDYVGLLFGVEMGKWDTATGALCDLDGDGDADLVSANLSGPLLAWENVSTVDEFGFGLQPHLLDIVDGPVGGVCGVSVTDLDGDKLVELVVVDTLGVSQCYQGDVPCLRHLLNLGPISGRAGEPPN